MSENATGFILVTSVLVALLCGCIAYINLPPLQIEPVDYCYDLKYVSDPADSSIVGAMIQFHLIVENIADTSIELPKEVSGRELLVEANIVHPSGTISSRSLGSISLEKEPNAIILPHEKYTLRQATPKLLALNDGDCVDFIEIYDPDSGHKYIINFGGARDWFWFDDKQNKDSRSCDIPEVPTAWVELKISQEKLSVEKVDCNWQSNQHVAWTCPPGDNIRLCWRSGPIDSVKKVVITYPDGKRSEKEPNGYDQPVSIQYTGQKELSFIAEAYNVNNQVIASDTSKLIFYDGVKELGKFYAYYDYGNRTFIAKLEDEIGPKILVLQYTIIGCSFNGGPVQVTHWSYPQYNSGADHSEVVYGVPPITKIVQNPFPAKGKWEFKLQETAPEPQPNVDAIYLCFSIKGVCI